MRLLRTTATSVLAATLLLGCGQSGAAASATGVDKAALISKEIKADPAQAAAVLNKHGLSVVEFDALMFRIADDAEQAEAFANKMGG